jgi:fatty acid elongase 3
LSLLLFPKYSIQLLLFNYFIMASLIPTLDRPFGIELWPVFEKVWMQFRDFPPQNFRFTPNVTPMSTIKETVIALVIYYVVVFGGRELMKSREPFKFPTIFKIHNLFLTLVSGSLLVLFIEQLLPTVVRHGIFYAICDADGGWTNRLVTLYYVGSISQTP